MKPLKALMVGIIGLLAVGCASTPTMKSVAGTYEYNVDGDTGKMVFLDNGVFEGYTNGNKEAEVKWKIVDGDIHAGLTGKGDAVIRVNKDGSLTIIAKIGKDGKREETPKDKQITLKKMN